MRKSNLNDDPSDLTIFALELCLFSWTVLLRFIFPQLKIMKLMLCSLKLASVLLPYQLLLLFSIHLISHPSTLNLQLSLCMIFIL